MINIYDFIVTNSSLFDQSKFGSKGDILIDYLCPIQEKKTSVWSHKNCLMYVVQGAKGYDTFQHYHQSGKHQVLFIRKGGVVLHQFFKEPYRALIFMFDDNTILEIMSEYPLLFVVGHNQNIDLEEYPPITELKSNVHVQSIFFSALDYLKNPAPESTISLSIKFKELIINVLREKGSNAFVQYLSWVCRDNDASFIKLMRENCHNQFTVKELARLSCMSLSTFKREFVRILGVPPGKWMNDQRVTRALYLLRHTEKLIGEIAFDLGYNDASAFSRWFKQQTNQSPVEYRGSV